MNGVETLSKCKQIYNHETSGIWVSCRHGMKSELGCKSLGCKQNHNKIHRFGWLGRITNYATGRLHHDWWSLGKPHRRQGCIFYDVNCAFFVRIGGESYPKWPKNFRLVNDDTICRQKWIDNRHYYLEIRVGLASHALFTMTGTMHILSYMGYAWICFIWRFALTCCIRTGKMVNIPSWGTPLTRPIL